MKRILEGDDLLALQQDRPANLAQQWTVIIPAAGRGTRLQSSVPKVLFPFNGRPLISWPISLLQPFCERFILILSPENKAAVGAYLQENLSHPFAVVIQEKPLGMGHAVLCAKEQVTTPYCLVVWGDQVGLRAETVRECLNAFESRPGVLLTMPTVWKRNSYIHLERGREGCLKKILHQREGEVIPDPAESDCGIFFFESKTLFSLLNQFQGSDLVYGKETGEFNLLPLLPLFEKEEGSTQYVRNAREQESIGINTTEDAQILKDCLWTKKLT